MPLFHIKEKRVARIAPRDEKLKEAYVHQLIEHNLNSLFDDLQFIKSKPRIGGREFDTLALNTATKAPVIVEYKRDRSRTVVEQVDLYYVKLKHNKPDVMVLLSQQGSVEDLGEVDFENPQIIAIAKEFTPEQREVASMKREYLRLFRYQLYDGNILSLEEVEPLGLPSDHRLRPPTSGAAGASRPLEHFGMKPETRELYRQLDEKITALDSRVRPGKVNKGYVGYGATGAYFCTVSPKVKFLKVRIKCTGSPPAVRGVTVRKDEHGPMNYIFYVNSQGQLKPALKLIMKALQDSL